MGDDARSSEGVFHRVRDRLLGTDVFISYGRADADGYAAELHADLVRRGLTCFRDREHAPAGPKLEPTLRAALRRSSMLVVIGSEAAAASKYVAQEIDAFGRADRVVYVDVEGAALRAAWPEVEQRIRLDESLRALEGGRPSAKVIDEVVHAYRFGRRNTWALALMVGVVLALGGLAALAIDSARDAQQQKTEAEKKAEEAKKAQEFAEAKTKEAQDGRRREERLAAEKKATRLAGEALDVVASKPQLGLLLALAARDLALTPEVRRALNRVVSIPQPTDQLDGVQSIFAGLDGPWVHRDRELMRFDPDRGWVTVDLPGKIQISNFSVSSEGCMAVAAALDVEVSVRCGASWMVLPSGVTTRTLRWAPDGRQLLLVVSDLSLSLVILARWTPEGALERVRWEGGGEVWPLLEPLIEKLCIGVPSCEPLGTSMGRIVDARWAPDDSGRAAIATARGAWVIAEDWTPTRVVEDIAPEVLAWSNDEPSRLLLVSRRGDVSTWAPGGSTSAIESREDLRITDAGWMRGGGVWLADESSDGIFSVDPISGEGLGGHWELRDPKAYWSADGAHAVFSNDLDRVSLMEVRDGRLELVRLLTVKDSGFARWNADGTRVAVFFEGAVEVFDAQGYRLAELPGHARPSSVGRARSVALVWSDDGQSLTTLDGRERARRWSLKGGTLPFDDMPILVGDTEAVHVDPTGERIVLPVDSLQVLEHLSLHDLEGRRLAKVEVGGTLTTGHWSANGAAYAASFGRDYGDNLVVSVIGRDGGVLARHEKTAAAAPTIALHPSARSVVWCQESLADDSSGEMVVMTWNLVDPPQALPIEPLEDHCDLGWSPSGEHLLVRDSGGAVVVAAAGASTVSLDDADFVEWSPVRDVLGGWHDEGFSFWSADDGFARHAVPSTSSSSSADHVWSPAGDEVALMSLVREAPNPIVLSIVSPTVPPRTLAELPSLGLEYDPELRWGAAPGGLFVLGPSGGRLVDSSTGKVRELASLSVHSESPSWSPRGGFVSSQDAPSQDERRCLVHDRLGAPVLIVGTKEEPCERVHWLDEARLLAFFHGPKGRVRMRLLHLDDAVLWERAKDLVARELMSEERRRFSIDG